MDPPVDGKRQRHGGGRQKAAPKSERVRWSLREVEAKGVGMKDGSWVFVGGGGGGAGGKERGGGGGGGEGGGGGGGGGGGRGGGLGRKRERGGGGGRG